MKKRIAVFSLFLALCLCAVSLTAFADGNPWSEQYYRALDFSETLSEAERNDLDETCISFMETHSLDLAMFAVPSAILDEQGDTLAEAAEEIYEEFGYGYGEGHDGFAVAFNPDTQETVIVPLGAARGRVSDDDLDAVAQSVPHYVEEHGIYGGFYAASKLLSYSLENGGSSGLTPAGAGEAVLNGSGLPDWYPDDPQNFQFFHDPNAPRVVDAADLFSDEAERRMEARLAEIRSELGRDIVVYTDTTSYGMSHRVWAADFYDFNGYGIGEDREGMCLFICMDPDDRGWWVCCTGPDTMALYTEEAANDMDDVLYEYLSDGDYTDGVEDWIENARTLYAKGMPFAPAWYPGRGETFAPFRDAAAPRIVDDADVLAESERADLAARAAALSAKYGMDVVIHTASTSYGMSRDEYADAFYRYNGYGFGEDFDGIGLVVFQNSGRAIITASGAGAQKLTDVNRERLADRTQSLSEDKKFYEAANLWLDLVDHMQRTGRVPRSAGSWGLTAIGDALASAVVGAVALGRAKRRMAVPKVQTNADAYLVAGSLQVQRTGDQFLHTTTSRRYAPVRESSNRGSGGGSSYSSSYSGSSGSSHSGSGRRF